MNYIYWIVGGVCTALGFGAGYYIGKKREERLSEYDIESVKEAYQNKIDQLKKEKQDLRSMICAVDETALTEEQKQKLTPNGDIDDGTVETCGVDEAEKNCGDDVVYFAEDKVFYNQDQEKTYYDSDPFDYPADLFSYFGDDDDKCSLIGLHNMMTEEYFTLRYNPGSYAKNVLGYEGGDA